MIRWLIAVLLSCSFSTAAIAASAVTGPEVYGFRVEKISKDDDAYRQGNIYLLIGPDGREQYIIVRDLSGAVAIVKREPVRK